VRDRVLSLWAFILGTTLIVCAVVLMFRRSEAGISRFHLFGQTVELPTPALVVLAAGVALFALPFFRPPPEDAVPWQRLLPMAAPPEPRPVRRTALDTAFVEEAEPNDVVHEANVMAFGETVRAALGHGDDTDWFAVDLPEGGRDRPARVVLRPLELENGFLQVAAFDANERQLANKVAFDVESFEVAPAGQYLVRVSKSAPEARARYELFVGDSR
jgi:hypothetical protein